MPKSPILLHYNTKKPVLKFKRHVASNTDHLYLLLTLFLNLSIGKCLDAKTVIFTVQTKIKQIDDSIYLIKVSKTRLVQFTYRLSRESFLWDLSLFVLYCTICKIHLLIETIHFFRLIPRNAIPGMLKSDLHTLQGATIFTFFYFLIGWLKSNHPIS